MPPPQVTHGSNLPGALLFVTYTPKAPANNGKKYSGVAYDPYAQPNDTAATLTARYKQGNEPGNFPYYQLFTTPDATKDNVAKWNVDGETYMGTFGKHPGPGSPTWPYAGEANSAIKDGIVISYWNKNNGSGCETNGVGHRFNVGAKTTYMSLNPGKGIDLLSAAGIPSEIFSAITLEWYAMKSPNKLNL
ncbi:hypothetical protein CLAIMM_11978 [Cladophialophora immunda]|nr:hypothetical protein CLAIMM_11978 [Cladophialophora immunda]